MAIPHSSCPSTAPSPMSLAVIPQDIMLEIAEYLDLGSMTALMQVGALRSEHSIATCERTRIFSDLQINILVC